MKITVKAASLWAAFMVNAHSKNHRFETGDRTGFWRSLRENQLSSVVSIDRCNTGCKVLRWRLAAQGLSRSLVELASDGAEFGLAKARYINAFRDVLSEKSVGIIVAIADGDR